MKVSGLTMAALDSAHEGQLHSWDYASGTLSALKKRGWVRQVDATPRGRRYQTTEAGERARDAILAGEEPEG